MSQLISHSMTAAQSDRRPPATAGPQGYMQKRGQRWHMFLKSASHHPSPQPFEPLLEMALDLLAPGLAAPVAQPQDVSGGLPTRLMTLWAKRLDQSVSR